MVSLNWTRWSDSTGVSVFRTGEEQSWADGRTQGGRRRGGAAPPPERTTRFPIPWRRDGELKNAQGNSTRTQKGKWKDHREVRHECWATPGTPAPAADSACSHRAHAATAGKPPIKCYFGQRALKPPKLTFSCGWACISHYSCVKTVHNRVHTWCPFPLCAALILLLHGAVPTCCFSTPVSVIPHNRELLWSCLDSTGCKNQSRICVKMKTLKENHILLALKRSLFIMLMNKEHIKVGQC